MRSRLTAGKFITEEISEVFSRAVSQKYVGWIVRFQISERKNVF
jgi:hypothetical protein